MSEGKRLPELERDLETAEQTLGIFAEMLADEDRDRDAGEALRLKSSILKYRMDLSPGDRQP